MSYTVVELISEAYYASGIVSKEFTGVTGQQMQDGLRYLNQILADTTIEKDMIPYFSEYNWFVQSGVETYFIPNLESPDTLVFFLDNVRYQMRYINRKAYRGSSRPNNISTLPFNWNFERCAGGGLISLYFFPQDNYPLQIWGLFRLGSVMLGQDLTSSQATVNLGLCSVSGTGNLQQGQLVINGVDLMGTYANVAALITYINSGVIPGVSAALILNNFYLFNIPQSNVISSNTTITNSEILIATNGLFGLANNITFGNFSTNSGYLNQTYFPILLDQFYINYLEMRLAERICFKYNFVVPPGVARLLAEYQEMISKRSAPMDLTQNKISTFSNGNTIDWAQVNLGLGWTVG